MPQFKHHDLRLLNPSFASPLVDVVNDLEYLRRLEMSGTTPYCVFAQLKQVFHFLESLASARIEGNNTTLADYVEHKVTKVRESTEDFREIENIEAAMRNVEGTVQPGSPITETLIRGVHAVTVKDLTREGDATPGAYRKGPVSIRGAEHLPPEPLRVAEYMRELEQFVNSEHAPKYELMKVALAHHRFLWIHPFSNGNGRVVRLLTYAMMLKYGFRVAAHGRLLNPAAVFGADRSRYYRMLALADTGSADGLEQWCTYVLAGVRDELKKVDRLADYKYLQAAVLLPALAFALERQLVTPEEEAVLSVTIKEGEVKAADLEPAMSGLNAAQRTYRLKKLVNAGMLQPVAKGARQYTIGFSHNMLLRGVLRALTDQGFVPPPVVKPEQPKTAEAPEPAAQS
jgi:Fic family protein